MMNQAHTSEVQAIEVTHLEESSKSCGQYNSCRAEQFIVINDAKLHYRRAGNGPHAILFIPGAVAPCTWAFNYQLRYFGKDDSGYTVITYDPRGYGYSRPPDRDFQIHPKHHTKCDATDAHQLMQVLGFTKYSVLGWCSGGVTAICLSAQFLNSIISLIVVGCRTYYKEDDVSRVETMNNVKKWNKLLLKTCSDCYGSEAQTEQLMRRVSKSIVDTYELSDGYLCTEEMTEVVCPTLVVHGERDKITLRSQAEYICQHISNSELKVFADAGHAPHLSCSDIFNTTIEEFLHTAAPHQQPQK